MRNRNATKDDLFDEYNKRAEETKKRYDETETKLKTYTAAYETEAALKEVRDREKTARHEMTEFKNRGTARLN